MKKTAILIMLITMVSKIIGFGREITLSYLYGASGISDAYLISLTIPAVIFGFVVAGLNVGYIPLYSKILKNEGQPEANKFTNNLLNVVLVICTIIILVCLLFTEQVVKVFASGFEGETLALAVQFTQISLLAIYFMGIVAIFKGDFQIRGNFTIPALVGLPLNFFIILSIVISSFTSVWVLAIGFVVASASQVILMMPYLRKYKFKYKFIFNLKDKHMVNMGYIILPVILGISVNQINMLVDRTLASQVAVGGISALNYASKLNGSVQGIFVLSIATVLFPTLSKMAAEKNLIGLKKLVSEAMTGINLLVLPVTVISMIFAVPIVSLLFGRGAFDDQATVMTANALFFYSLGMVAFGLRDILSRTFYSMQDTKTPMINAAIGMMLNIVLNFILSRYLGIGGLALATSIAGVFTTGLLFISLRKKIGAFGMKQFSFTSVKILTASLLMGFVAKLIFDYLITILSPNLSLTISIIMGFIIYIGLIYIMKIKDVDMLVQAVKKKIARS